MDTEAELTSSLPGRPPGRRTPRARGARPARSPRCGGGHRVRRHEPAGHRQADCSLAITRAACTRIQAPRRPSGTTAATEAQSTAAGITLAGQSTELGKDQAALARAQIDVSPTASTSPLSTPVCPASSRPSTRSRWTMSGGPPRPWLGREHLQIRASGGLVTVTAPRSVVGPTVPTPRACTSSMTVPEPTRKRVALSRALHAHQVHLARLGVVALLLTAAMVSDPVLHARLDGAHGSLDAAPPTRRDEAGGLRHSRPWPRPPPA